VIGSKTASRPTTADIIHHKLSRKMSAMTPRTATISRKTNETSIEVYINLDCQPGSASQQTIDISTGIGFLDHVRSHPPNLASLFVLLFSTRPQSD
jgi:hypothetical protein